MKNNALLVFALSILAACQPQQKTRALPTVLPPLRMLRARAFQSAPILFSSFRTIIPTRRYQPTVGG